MDTLDVMTLAIEARRVVMTCDAKTDPRWADRANYALGRADGYCAVVADDMDCEPARIQHLASWWACNRPGPIDPMELDPDLLYVAVMPDDVYHRS